jgi:hypothetical protein
MGVVGAEDEAVGIDEEQAGRAEGRPFLVGWGTYYSVQRAACGVRGVGSGLRKYYGPRTLAETKGHDAGET